MASPPRRRVALVTVTAVLAGLAGIVGARLAPATAANNPGAHLQVTPELAFASSSAGAATIRVTAHLTGSSSGTPVAFEIEGGPADVDGPTSQTPDMHCIADGSNTCFIDITSAGSGSGLIRSWVDPDYTGNPITPTNEADLGEGRLANNTPFVNEQATPQSDCIDSPQPPPVEEDTPNEECLQGPVQPGTEDVTNSDDTDVTQYTFAGAAARLDCFDSTEINGRDKETNPRGSNETITCRVTDGSGTIVKGAFIDGENLSQTDSAADGFGANDADGSAAPPDYDTTDPTNPVTGKNACTTRDDGTCAVTVSGTLGEVGPAYVCFWIDGNTQPNGDALFTPNTPGAAGNGGDCGPNEPVNEAEGNDATDTILITWEDGPAVAKGLDIGEPESPSAAVGNSVVFNARVFDQFGDPFSSSMGINAEYFAGSTNDTDGNAPSGPGDRSCSTGGTSSCNITLTSSSIGTDLLCVWIPNMPTLTGNVDDGKCGSEANASDYEGIADGGALDNVDVVRAVWTTGSSSGGGGGGGGSGSKAQGYVLVGSDGGIFTFGTAQFKGSLGDKKLNQPIIGIAYKPGGTGYWLVAKDGGVFTFGDANFYGSTGDRTLNAPVLGMEATPDGGGYWLFAADGGIFTFGNAKFHGSTGDRKLNAPMVGMAVNNAGDGYWLVAQDGGIFTFNAPFYGSTGDRKLNQPVFDMAVAKGDKGYWLVARDGGIFTFGPGTPFYGSGVGNMTSTVIGMDATPTGEGYWIADAAGKVLPLGDAGFLGDRSGKTNNTSMVAFATVRPA